VWSRAALFISLASVCSAQLSPVFLSHVYVVIDRVSYDAIRHSKEIRALASVEEKTLAVGKAEWTAFFITGRQTVIEILAAGPRPSGGEWRLGQSGIGLANVDADGMAHTEKRLRTLFGDKVRVRADTRKTSAGDVPWFPEIVVEGSESDALSTWFTEVHPGYFVARYPAPNNGRSPNRDEWFATAFLADHLLDDVVGLTVALNPAESAVLIDELKVAGWMMHQWDDKTVMSGPDVAITIVPTRSRAGIRQAELRLRRPVARQETALAVAKLVLDGEMGHLDFWAEN
jgi:hypothetical protein